MYNKKIFKLNRNIVKYLFFVVFLILFLYLVIFRLNINNNYSLRIGTNQDDSTILIRSNTNEYKGIGSFNEKIPADLYNIKISKDEFITEELQIKLDSEKDINVKLFPSSKTKIEETYKNESFVYLSDTNQQGEGIFYGIDRSNGYLVEYNKGAKRTIYEGVIKSYHVNNEFIVILDKNKSDRIFLINKNSFIQTMIQMTGISPIASVSISPNNDIYMLGNFDLKTKSFSLHKTDKNGGNIQVLIKKTNAQSLEVLNENLLLLITENHEVDKNRVDFYDINKKEIILTKYTSWYNISPSRLNILFHRSNEFEIYNVKTSKSIQNNLLESRRSVWKNDNTLYIFRNHEGDSYYSRININPFEVQPFEELIKGVQVQNIFGIDGEKIILQDYNEKIFSIELN